MSGFQKKQIPVLQPDDSYGLLRSVSALSSDGELVVRCRNSRRPVIVTLATGAEHLVGKENRYVNDVRVSASGWATVVDDKTVQVIELATGESSSFRISEATHAAMFAPGVLLVRVGDQLVFVDAKTGKSKGAPLQKNVFEFVVSPTGVVAATSDVARNHVTIWQGKKKVVVAALKSDFQAHAPRFLSFSPDGTRLAMWAQANSEGREERFAPKLRIVNVNDGKDVVTLGHPLASLSGLTPTLGPTLLGFVLCSNDEGLVESTACLPDRSRMTVQLSKIDLRRAENRCELLLETPPGVDEVLALSPSRVVVNRGLFYERDSFGAVTAAKPVEPVAKKAPAKKPAAKPKKK